MKMALLFESCIETGKRDLLGAKVYRTLREAKKEAKQFNSCFSKTTQVGSEQKLNWKYDAAYYTLTEAK